MALIVVSEETQFGPPDPRAGEYYSQAVEYLQGSGTARKIIKDLETCNRDIYLVIYDGAFSMFLHHEKAREFGLDGAVIVWNPKATVSAHAKNSATMQSPAVGLAHEMGHAVQWVKNRGWFLAYVGKVLAGDAQKTGSVAYKAKMIIENDNIATYETPVAKELGEGTRSDYNDAATGADFRKAESNYKCPYSLLALGH